MRDTLTLLVVAVFLSALSGCADMLESREPAERIYWLEPVVDDRAQSTGGQTVEVRVGVVPGLNSDRIWLLESDQRLNYYAGARWAGNLVDVLQSVLDRSLNPLGTPSEKGGEKGTENPVSLEVLIERFFAIATAPDQPPRIELRARIHPAHRPSAGCLFSMSSQSESLRLKDIVQAHQWLLNQLTGRLAEVAEQVRSDEPVNC